MDGGEAFRVADDQVPAGDEALHQVTDQLLLGGAVEVDHHVAAEDDVERLAQRPLRRHQVVRAELDQLGQLRADAHEAGIRAGAALAVAAGVSAYVVAGLQPERIRPILDVAMARFEQDQALRAELADAKTEVQDLNTELKNRRVIDRAKGLLMQRQGLSEQAAYEKLRKSAMDKGLKVVDVSQRMLDAMDLLG